MVVRVVNAFQWQDRWFFPDWRVDLPNPTAALLIEQGYAVPDTENGLAGREVR